MSKNNKKVEKEKDEKYVLTGAGKYEAKHNSSRLTKGNNELSKSIFRLMFKLNNPVDIISLAKQLKKSSNDIQLVLIKGIRDGLVEKIEVSPGLAFS